MVDSIKKIDSSDIGSALVNKCFINEFVLQNVFVYDWESDFLYQTKTGYFVECEVKISRSDFFADFKKENKHNILKMRFEKKQYMVHRLNKTHEYPPFFTFNQIRLKSESDFLIGFGKIYKTDLSFTHEEDSFGYWHQIRERDLFHFNVASIYPTKTNIRIIDINKKSLPNCFYYVCPKGLLKVEEIPSYAGLMYFDNEEITDKIKIVKKAPHIHKDKPSDGFWKMMARKLWFYFKH